MRRSARAARLLVAQLGCAAALCGAAALAPQGCVLFTHEFACDGDEGCPFDRVCVAGRCQAPGSAPDPDGGALADGGRDDGGRDDGGEQDGGEGPPDGGFVVDGGFGPEDAGPFDAGPCVDRAGGVVLQSGADVASLVADAGPCVRVVGAVTLGAGLVDLAGFEPVVEITGTLLADDADALQTFQGASSLARIGGSLDVRDNDALTSLDGLSSLSRVGVDVIIRDNLALDQDHARGFADALVVGGEVRVEGNGG